MNRDQFSSHVASTQESLRRFLAALCCGDTQLADDIAQEAYMRAYMACNTIKDTTKFKCWIFSIAHNCFINNRRSIKLLSDYSEASTIIAADKADSAFKYQELYNALAKLSGKERTAILLHYMEGYSIKEISTITSSSENAVKQLLSRGREHLRELLH